jgi:membrane protease YdiL (CAAX protease family)
MFDWTNRYDFLGIALLFEGTMIGIAGLLGRWLGVHPLAELSWTLAGLAWGVACTGPLLLVFAISYRYPVGGLRHIKQILMETLGPSLANCRWYDLLLLGAVAGVSEELLFRGVLHPAMGLVGSNIVFALVHAVSPLYAVLAGGIGILLGWQLNESQNLLAPILTHSLYDFVAFLVIARDARRLFPDKDEA